MFTKEAVEDMVNKLNGSERAMPGIVNHDLTALPFRKFVKAELIKESGKYGGAVTMVFGEQYPVLLNDLPDTELVLMHWEDDLRLFARVGQEVAGDVMTVTVDLGDFESPEQCEVFLRDINAMEGARSGDLMGRHSVDPTPIVEFFLSNWEAIATIAGSKWFLSRVAKYMTGVTDELLARRVGPTCDLIEAKLSAVRKAYSRARGKSDEETDLYVVIEWDEIEFVLLLRSGRDSDNICLCFDRLGETLDQYSSLLDHADSVVFSQSEDGGWHFEHAKLKDGDVIGSRVCAERTLEQLRAIGNAARARRDE